MRWATPALLVVVACGAGVQQATISAPTAQPSSAVSVTQDRWLLVRERSRIEVVGVDIMGGKHPVTFDQWEGSVVIGPPNRVSFVVETSTARGQSETVTRLLKYELLDVEKYPQASFTGTIDERGHIDGNATIHGVTRGLKFHGTLVREGTEYHFVARLKISRAAFDIRTEASWDSLIKDDVHLYVDLRAKHVD